MRIGINGRFLVAKRTGVQRAAYNLVKTLVQIDRENEYFLFTGDDQIGRPEWDFPNVKVVGSKIREGENIRNHLWEQFTLPKLAHQHKVDLLHSPANVAPLFFKGKSIVNIHDLCFVVNPQWYSFSFRTLYNFVIPRLARRAARVITNSNHARNDLLQFFNLPADRVSFGYWAVDDTFVNPPESEIAPPPVSSAGEKSAASVLPLGESAALSPADYHPAPQSEDVWELKDYVLYVGSLQPRKNIKTLIEAYEEMRARHPEISTKLILIGGESPLFSEVRLKLKRFKEDVVFKGFVNDATLRQYYRHASLVAYPSLYEGFGLPPLEAMVSGVPVVTSMTSSIPEVVGDAALMVSPYDVSQLADAMYRALTDQDLRKLLIERGYKRVAKFNWFRVARNTLAVYYEVHNEKTNDRARAFLPFETWKNLVRIEEEQIAKSFLRPYVAPIPSPH